MSWESASEHCQRGGSNPMDEREGEEEILSNCCGAEIIYEDICKECFTYCRPIVVECWACDAKITESRAKASGLCEKCLPDDSQEND